MAISTSYSFLRRNLAQRLNYWGGDLQSNSPGTLTANGSTRTAIDITRSEPDDEWNEAWIVINPGSLDQAGSPTVWRRIAVDAGWVQSTGTFTIQGVWPAAYTNGPLAGTSYELFKVFRPENWLQAINWALARSYPHRHIPVNFEVPQDINTRIVQWGNLVSSLSMANPSIAPIVTEIADGMGNYQPGIYTFAYSYFNDLGETLVSPTFSLTIMGTNSRIQFAAFTGLPAQSLGVNYYGSIQPNDTTMGQLQIGQSVFAVTPPVGQLRGLQLFGALPATIFAIADSGYASFPPIYNTTNVDVQELHHILKRVNPGQFPEIWNDLGSDLYKPMGGKVIKVEFFPIPAYSLQFICTAVVPLMTKETDVTDEPPEMIYAGAESYLWNLLVKTSTIVGTNWADLAKQALVNFESLKDDYALDRPRTIAFRPLIRLQY